MADDSESTFPKANSSSAFNSTRPSRRAGSKFQLCFGLSRRTFVPGGMVGIRPVVQASLSARRSRSSSRRERASCSGSGLCGTPIRRHARLAEYRAFTFTRQPHAGERRVASEGRVAAGHCSCPLMMYQAGRTAEATPFSHLTSVQDDLTIVSKSLGRTDNRPLTCESGTGPGTCGPDVGRSRSRRMSPDLASKSTRRVH